MAAAGEYDECVSLMREAINAAGPLRRERALVGSIILHESEPGTWARTSTAAVMERMDTDWLSLELLAR